MTMPSMTGDILAGEILQIRPEIPVIMITGYSERINPDIAKAIGVRYLLDKPLNMETLSKTLRSVLDPPSVSN